MNARAALAGSSFGLGAACEGSDADALGSAPIERSGEAVARERRDASRGATGTGLFGAGGSAVAGSADTARGSGSMTRKVTSMAFNREMGAALGTALRVDSTTN